MKGLSVQLYSLREESKEDFDSVLDGVAAQGYDAVEPFNLFGKTPREFVRLVEGLGMQVSSSHFPWATTNPGTPLPADDFKMLVDTLSEFGLRRAIGGYMPDDVNTEQGLATTIAHTNALVDRLAQEGITLALHNHWWEFEAVADSDNTDLIYHRLQQGCPEVEFEVDTYWAANFGAVDAVQETARIATRAPLLHIKDGPLTKGEPMVAVGAGKQPIGGIIEATDPDVLEWLVVELDACATNMSEAVGASQTFLSNLLSTSSGT